MQTRPKDDLEKASEIEESPIEEVQAYKLRVKESQAGRTVRFTLLRDVILTFNGPITGKEYVFNRAGSQVDIDELDADEILKAMAGQAGSCCSGFMQPSPYFEVTR